MNKTMQSMMKPIPVERDTRADLRRRQEAHVLNWLSAQANSVNCRDVAIQCQGIPGLERGWHIQRSVSDILKRLEKQGQVISVLYGRYRYYSIPINVKQEKPDGWM